MAKLLNEERTRELIARAQRAKSSAAEDALLRANLGMVVAIAKRYAATSTMPLDDFIQEGMSGLLEAIRRFDVRRPVRLSTYATYWIRQRCSRAREQWEYMGQVRGQADGTTDKDEHQLALSRPDLLDVEARPELPSPTDRADSIRPYLGVLSERERRIVVMCFGLDGEGERGWGEIARAMGFNSRARVGQLFTLAMTRMRRVAGLPEYRRGNGYWVAQGVKKGRRPAA